MAGTYAHFMIAEEARARIRDDSTVPRRHILKTSWPFVMAGAVAPDYPYLVLLSPANKGWADRMHYQRTGDMIRAGLASLHEGGDDRAVAWLLGYMSHVVVDAVVHPVINDIVGPYAQHKTEHRLCEMVQDSHIFKEVKGIEITKAEYVDFLRDASAPEDRKALHPEIVGIWKRMLETVYPDAASGSPPEIDRWHKAYFQKLDAADERIALFRHVGEEAAILYQPSNEISAEHKRRFIEDLPVPGGGRQDYSRLFERAVRTVMEAWRGLLWEVNQPSGWMAAWVKNWNLDTGVDMEAGSGAPPYFWA